jgi:hypothetical protein
MTHRHSWRKSHPEDYKFVREMACLADAEGLEKKRKLELEQHKQAKVNKRLAAKEMRAAHVVQKAARIQAITIIEDKEEVKELKGQKLRDTLAAYKKWGAPIPANVTTSSVVAAIRTALVDAIEGYNAGDWQFKGPSQVDSDNESTYAAEECEDESEWEVEDE